MNHCLNILFILLLYWSGSGNSDNVINDFVDRYLNNLWDEAELKQLCYQHLPGRVFEDVGKSSVRITTSNAVTKFMCESRRDGEVLIKISDDFIKFKIPLKVEPILFSFKNVEISSSDQKSSKDLGPVDFLTEGEVTVEIIFKFPKGLLSCLTETDIDVTKLQDFNCFVQGSKSKHFQNWINSNMKSKFAAYMEKQYCNFFNSLDICNYFIRFNISDKDTTVLKNGLSLEEAYKSSD